MLSVQALPEKFKRKPGPEQRLKWGRGVRARVWGTLLVGSEDHIGCQRLKPIELCASPVSSLFTVNVSAPVWGKSAAGKWGCAQAEAGLDHEVKVRWVWTGALQVSLR